MVGVAVVVGVAVAVAVGVVVVVVVGVAVVVGVVVVVGVAVGVAVGVGVVVAVGEFSMTHLRLLSVRQAAGLKRCSKCKEEKPLDEFHKNSGKKSGLDTRCKECKKKDLSVDHKHEIYYKLRLIREAEKAIIREYPTNDIKTPSHLAIGAEAIAVATTQMFRGAKIFGTYRNHHWYLATGGSVENFFLELYGKQNPIADGKAGSMHLNCPDEGLILTSAVVASQIGPAIGHAFAMKYKGDDTLTICSLGDGATEEGVFYECLNLAVLHQLKILFVVEDNLLAIHQHKKDRQMFRLIKLVRAYNEIKPIMFYEGKAYSYSDAASTVCWVKKFPAVLHLWYHRFYEHVGINQDYEAGYRERPENLKELDPVERFARKLSQGPREEIDERVRKEIESAIAKAKAAPLAPKESLLEHVWAT